MLRYNKSGRRVEEEAVVERKFIYTFWNTTAKFAVSGHCEDFMLGAKSRHPGEA